MERYGSEEEFFSAMDERAQEDSEMAAKEADGQAAAYEAQRETDNISFGKSEDCPYCPNQGWYLDGDPEDPGNRPNVNGAGQLLIQNSTLREGDNENRNQNTKGC